MSKSFSVAEVGEHINADKGLYIIVDENVYDITSKEKKFCNSIPFIFPSSSLAQILLDFLACNC